MGCLASKPPQVKSNMSKESDYGTVRGSFLANKLFLGNSKGRQESKHQFILYKVLPALTNSDLAIVTLLARKLERFTKSTVF